MTLKSYRYRVHTGFTSGWILKNLQVIIAFRNRIVRNPEKQHSIEKSKLYHMLFFRISNDTFIQTYDRRKTLYTKLCACVRAPVTPSLFKKHKNLYLSIYLYVSINLYYIYIYIYIQGWRSPWTPAGPPPRGSSSPSASAPTRTPPSVCICVCMMGSYICMDIYII